MKTLIAHRGMSCLAPENTLSAFSLAKKYNIDWIECDVDILQDGTLVVSHDDTLDRCTDKHGKLHTLRAEDLRHIDAGSWFSDKYVNERIPTVHSLIQLANKIKLNLNIEIKSCTTGAYYTHKLIDGIIIALDELDERRELIVSSFNYLILHEIKKQRPKTKVACLFEAHTLYDDWKSIIEWCGAEYIHPENKELTENMIQKFKSENLKINVWTVNDLGRANELFNWGVDGIFTDIGHKFPSKYRNAQ
ncbi:TPA: glycerophosphoryl diester phosphodiesterase [Salmonella enterica]|uniref:Glycerophosphoryl diester phosphodiesterase n=1 Tax=Salmonella enterica TaxID=28901 RepID=A0A759H3A2_SALER|nr:glycerophosphoryl diester phosphodiesterase [Salmonella enterica]HAG5359032.1 glycerophosphoryl diester phosphodiesterase [Salmonella enterica]